MHHAVYDGWAMRMMFETLHKVYWEMEVAPMKPFANFVDYVININPVDADNYWSTYLEGAKRSVFPPPLPVVMGSKSHKENTMPIIKTLSFPTSRDTSITKATLVRATWAKILARHSNSTDITFGLTVSGCNAPVSGLDLMPGPSIATVPVRVRFDNVQQNVRDFLQDLQDQAHDTITYEQYGLSNISKSSSDAKAACDFSSLIVIQPLERYGHGSESQPVIEFSEDTMIHTTESLAHNYFNYPLVLICAMNSDNICLQFYYKASILSHEYVVAISN